MTIRVLHFSLFTTTLALSMSFSSHLIFPAQAQTQQSIPLRTLLQNGNGTRFAPFQNWNRNPTNYPVPTRIINPLDLRIKNPLDLIDRGTRERMIPQQMLDPNQVRPLMERWERQQRQQRQQQRKQEELFRNINTTIINRSPTQEAQGLIEEGIGYYRINRFEAAIRSWEKALTLYSKIEDRNPKTLATIFKNLGKAYYNLGQYTNAIENFESSLTMFRQKANQKGEAEALMGIGDTYNTLGQSAKANKLYEQSLTIARATGERIIEIELKNRLAKANTNISLDQGLEVIRLLEEFRDIARDTGDRYAEARSLNDLGQTYLSIGEKTKAILLYNDALVLAREIEDRYNEGYALKNLGDAYFFLWQSPRAMDFYNQALVIFRQIKARRSEGDILNNLGEGFLKTGNLIEAEKHLFDAIAIWEMLRSPKLSDPDKISLFETQQTTYRLLQQVLIAQNKFEAALEVAERGRARAFLELLAQRLGSQPISSDNVIAPKGLKSSEATCRGNLNTCNGTNTIAPLLREQIQQIARTQNATLVQYSIISKRVAFKERIEIKESEIYIWVVKPTGEIVFRRSNLKPLWQQQNISLKELVLSSRDSIGVRGRGIVVPTRVRDSQSSQIKQLQQLHQLLVEPIADQLPSDPNNRVIFIPQSELFLVPFPALQDKEGKYLIEKHTILTSPAIQLLDLTHKQRQLVSGTDIVVVGNPTMPSIPSNTGEAPQQLPTLPGAEAEAKEIAQLFNTTAITGKEATKANILGQLPKAKIIHLATHGILDDFKELGVPGLIALAPSSDDNGWLAASEILDLKLQAELVVLSACDTGRGQITGDGVIGLSRSFILAGTPSVVVSLWAVPDTPTASLMTEFYQNLQKKLDKAQALRQAMLKMIKENPAPRNWAAFTLIGEAE